MSLSQSAYGNKPESLEDANPSEATAQPAPEAPSIPSGSVEMPPMTIQAGPDRAPAEELPSDFQPPSQTAELPSDFLPSDFQPSAPTASPVSVPPEPMSGEPGNKAANAATQLMSDLVKLPDGSYGVMGNDKHVRSLSTGEKTALRYVAHGIEILGPIAGAAFGALGMAAADVPSHILAKGLHELAGDHPEPISVSNTAKSAALTLAGATAGSLVGKSFAASGITNMAKAAPTAAEELAAQGATKIAADKASGEKSIESAGLKNVPEDTLATPALEAGIKQEIQSKMDAIKTKYQGGSTTPLGEHVQGIREDLGVDVGMHAQKAIEAARQRRFDVSELDRAFQQEIKHSPDPAKLEKLYSKLKSEIKPEVSSEGLGATGNKTPTNSPYAGPGSGVDIGKYQYDFQGTQVGNTGPGPMTHKMGFKDTYTLPESAPNASSYDYKPGSISEQQAGKELPPNEAGTASRGQTLGEMKTWLEKFKNGANFGKATTPNQAAFGRLYRSLRLIRDDVSANVLAEAGQPETAKLLRDSRDKFKTFSDEADTFSKAIEKNPSQAASILAKKGDLRQANILQSLLPADQFQKLGMHIIEDVSSVAADKGPKAALVKLDSYDSQVAKTYLGEDGYSAVKTLLNGGQALAQKLSQAGAEKALSAEALIRKMAHAARHPLLASAELGGKLLDSMGISGQVKAAILKSSPESNIGKVAGAATAQGLNSLTGSTESRGRSPQGFASDMEAVDRYEEQQAAKEKAQKSSEQKPAGNGKDYDVVGKTKSGHKIVRLR